jgi:hypothetical protein
MSAAVPATAHVAEAVLGLVGASLIILGVIKKRDDTETLLIAGVRVLFAWARASWGRTGIIAVVSAVLAFCAWHFGAAATRSVKIACGGATEIICDLPLSDQIALSCSRGHSEVVRGWFPMGVERVQTQCDCRSDHGGDAKPVVAAGDALACPEPAAETVATKDELGVLNEWVAVIAGATEYTQASEMRKQFIAAYPSLGHVGGDGKPIWINVIRVVRDPNHAGRWLVVIDTYSKASSRACVKFAIAEMITTLDGKRGTPEFRDVYDQLGGFLNSAYPMCYDMGEFETTYGHVSNEPDTGGQRSLGSCKAKLEQRHPERHCAHDDD